MVPVRVHQAGSDNAKACTFKAFSTLLEHRTQAHSHTVAPTSTVRYQTQ